MRDLDPGRRVAADITATTGNTAVSAARLDLADAASVTAFTHAWTGPLRVLVNNAGVMMTLETYTPQG